MEESHPSTPKAPKSGAPPPPYALRFCLGLLVAAFVFLLSFTPGSLRGQTIPNSLSPLATPATRFQDGATAAYFAVEQPHSEPAAAAPPGLIAGTLSPPTVEAGQRTDLTLVGGVLFGLLVVIGLVAWRRR